MTDLQLTAEELKIFDEFYQRRLAEAGGARDDAQELEIARDILLAVVNDGLTPAADGGASYVRRGAMDWTDPATMQAAQAATSNGRTRSRAVGRQGRKSDLWQGLLVIVVALVAAAWFLWPAGEAESEPVESTVVAEAEGTGATPTPLPTLEAELLADIVDASGVKTELVVPRTLEVKGVSFVVQPVRIAAGDWPLPDDERAVSWVYGTVINYILGVEATADNKTLLASLQAGDELFLRMSTGPAYRFAFADTVRVAPQASEVFRQTRPGLTLVLMNDEAQASRVVIRALYIPESELGMRLSEPVEPAAIGQRVLLDGSVHLTCLGSDLMPQLDAPPGYVYVAVNYVAGNVGNDLPLVTSSFVHHIEADGMTYPPVSVADEGQPYPALPETLRAGQAFTTTAVYAVPEMALPGMAWEFAPAPSGTKTRVELPPYSGSLRPQVSVKEASLHDGTLLLSLELRATLRDTEVTATGIQVQGGTLNPVGNVFPWRVPAGSSGDFSLLLSPDGSGRLTVALLEQGFEVTY